MSDLTPYILYLLFAAGALAVFLRLPRGDQTKTAAGAVFGIAALVGLVALLHTQIAAPAQSRGYFYLFSVIAIVAAARVVTHPRPIWSALYLILVVLAVAALLVLDGAEFVAVALVIVYAGAILVTYLFVIMLAQQPGSPVYDRRVREPFLAVVAGFLMTGIIAGKVADSPPPHGRGAEGRSLEPPKRLVLASEGGAEADRSLTVAAQSAVAAESEESGNTLAIGQLVTTRYVAALEISGILLLVSMIGAVALSRKKVPADGFRAPTAPLGQVGKEVEPF